MDRRRPSRPATAPQDWSAGLRPASAPGGARSNLHMHALYDNAGVGAGGPYSAHRPDRAPRQFIGAVVHDVVGMTLDPFPLDLMP